MVYVLENFNGVPSYKLANWSNDIDFQLYTDDAGNDDLGCGEVFGHHWVYLGWPNHWKALDIFSDITFFELFPITMTFAICGSNLSGKRLIIHTDNEALVSILNFYTSKSKRAFA